MGDVSYKPLIEDMTWSYSRLGASCLYQWYLKYIKGKKEDDTWYASYGSLIHKAIELYYKGELPKSEMGTYFLEHYKSDIKGDRPEPKIYHKYIDIGFKYLQNFTPFPFNCVAVEKKVEFTVEGRKFVGYIDFLGEKDGEYYVVDNKSRDLKPRSSRAKPTVKDQELDGMLRQLYLYSEAVKQEFGKYPKELCFNCFKNGNFIREPFRMEALEEAKQYAKEHIEALENQEEFEPTTDMFKCKWLCGFHKECEAYQELVKEARWKRMHEKR